MSHIVALGGGGFSMEPNPVLDDFILSLARRRMPRVCFIPTASADSPGYVARFYRAFTGRAILTDLTLFDSPTLPRQPASTRDLAGFVAEQDVFYVGGGNTANMLATWHEHGLDRLLRQAWRAGAVMAGISAGMLCWFQGGITDSFGGYRPMRNGLGLIRAFGCPHHDGEPERQRVFRQMVRQSGIRGYAAEDGVALHFVGTRFQQAIASRPDARGYLLTRRNGEVVTTPLRTRWLR